MNRELYTFVILEKAHRQYRHRVDWNLAGEYAAAKLPPIERMIDRFERLCREERPVLLPGEQICYLRTVANLPPVFTEDEWADIRKTHYIHELGFMSNLSPNYYGTIAVGLLEKRKTADVYGQRAIDAILALADRYREEAQRQGRTDLAEVLTQVPRYPARNFREALQFFRILHFSLWLEGNYHNTIGRFDRYIGPYLERDLASGAQTRDTALALLEDFFLSFNKDSDLYPGVQQGDNGQSMMLGGVDENGNSVFCTLSELCLEASYNNKLIDPKINLRVGRDTPEEVYTKASHLTKAGLGFPQYSNDDVVIPALEQLGYAHEDAANYTVAACWEFIIPFVGADVANIGAVSYAKAIDVAFHHDLPDCATYEDFFAAVQRRIWEQCDDICAGLKNLWFVPSPFMHVLMDCDIYTGGKYNNYGIHGTGIATAADSLAAIRKYIYEDKSLTKAAYIKTVFLWFGITPGYYGDSYVWNLSLKKQGSDVNLFDNANFQRGGGTMAGWFFNGVDFGAVKKKLNFEVSELDRSIWKDKIIEVPEQEDPRDPNVNFTLERDSSLYDADHTVDPNIQNGGNTNFDTPDGSDVHTGERTHTAACATVSAFCLVLATAAVLYPRLKRKKQR